VNPVSFNRGAKVTVYSGNNQIYFSDFFEILKNFSLLIHSKQRTYFPIGVQM